MLTVAHVAIARDMVLPECSNEVSVLYVDPLLP